MSLVWTIDSTIIDAPLLVTTQTITITNSGTEALGDLGFYLKPASTVGSVDNPATQPPWSDYQDLISWGTATDLGTPSGGLKLTLDSTDYYFTRTQGSTNANRILLGTLEEDQSVEIVLTMESAGEARRLFVDLVLE